MEIGLVSAILPNISFEELVDYASNVGFKCLEVCCWPRGKATRRYAGVTHIDLDESNDEKLMYYKSYAEQKGVRISSLAYYPNAMDADDETAKVAVEHIYKLIDASAKMGVNMITTFIGKNKNKTVEENLELFATVWPPIVKYAEEKKVKIAIENCPMLYTANEWPGGNNLASTPDIWEKMFNIIPSDYLGLNYDPSHPYLLFADYIKPLYEFKDKIFHVHFKDIKIYQDKLDRYGIFAYPSLWHSPKLPGLGGIDFGAFISALNDIGYKGYACIEVEDRAFESSENKTKKGIEQSMRYLKQYM